MPLGVLDHFQVAGVFVNWWDNIKYDLKTIMTNGWSPSLIPDPYLIAAFFQSEQAEIEDLETEIGKAEAALDEAVEAARDLLEYELDEDEKLTPKLMKDQLGAVIKDLKEAFTPLFRTQQERAVRQQEIDRHQSALNAITRGENQLRELKRKLREKQFELEIKMVLKKFGPEDETAESRRLLAYAQNELAELEAVATPDKEQKKRMSALRGDMKTLQERIEAIERLTDQVGGMIIEAEAEELILRKHHDLLRGQLDRYLGAEKQVLMQALEGLSGKYAASTCILETRREAVMGELNTYMDGLRYLR